MANKRAYRSAEQWRSILDKQEKSGLTVRAFCQSHSLGYASFITWRRRLAGSDCDHTPASSFIELTPSGGAPSTPVLALPNSRESEALPVTIELSLGGGIELRITRAG